MLTRALVGICSGGLGMLFLVTSVLLASAEGKYGAAPICLSMTVDVKVTENGGYYLEISLSNDGERTIPSWEVNLPWTPTNWDLWVKATRLGSQQAELVPSGMMIDYESKDLLPFETVSGHLPLHAMFKSLREDIQEHGVQVEWRCPTDVLNVKCPQSETTYILSKNGILKMKRQDK